MKQDDPKLKKMIKMKKLKKAKLEKSEQKLLNVTDADELTKIVIKEINNKIKSIEKLIEDCNGNLIEENKIWKKNLITKVKKLKKVLKTPEEINYRIKLLKLQKRQIIRKERRIDKIQDKLKKLKLKCLLCKKKGHIVAECKENNEKKDESVIKDYSNNNYSKDKICFNCGKVDHSIYACNIPVDMKNLPFADCFICKNKGHLSSHCPNSENGIYIKGGSCFNCNSKEHLAKNCPQKQTVLHFENEKKDSSNYRNNFRAADKFNPSQRLK